MNSFIENVTVYVRRFAAWWQTQYAKRTGRGKVMFVALSLLFTCCICSLPLSAILPDPTPTPETTAEIAEATTEEQDTLAPEAETTSRANEIAAVVTDESNEPEPTNTVTPKPTVIPTMPATNTAVPIATSVPTSLPPTDVPTSPPTQLPPTSEPTAVPPTAPPPEPTTPLQPIAPPVTTGGLIIINVNKREEYVDIQNVSGTDVMMTGWTLRSEKGMQDCSLSGVGLFPAGYTLRVWALERPPADGEFSCQFGSEIWNNSEPDAAVLIDPNGNEVARR